MQCYYRWSTGLLLGLVLWVAGCEKKTPPEAPVAVQPPLPRSTSIHLDHAQPKLQTIKLYAGSQVLETEVAIRPAEVATGMMFRQDMAEHEAMLFVFAQPHRVSFYMKNTSVPLSAGYIGPDGTLLEIHNLMPLDENPVTANTDEVQYVLEVKQGWFERNNVPVGTLLKTEFGSLQETFLRRRAG